MATVYCTECGNNIPAISASCSRCGTPNRAQGALPTTGSPPPAAPGVPPMPGGPVALPPMTFGDAIGSFFRNYATFSGRARRSEFWFAWLFVFLMSLGFQLLTFFPSVEVALLGNALYLLWAVAVLVPSLAIVSRRLHDTDTSFGYYFLILIPIVGAILVIFKLATDGTPGPNRFGTSAKHQA